MFRTSVPGSLLCLAFLFTSSDATAQESSPSPPPVPDDVRRFESAVVVTATRSETAIAEAPVATSVVTGDELRARNVQTIDQGLSLLEGVYVFRTKGVADPTMRVMMRGFNGANRTLVLMDGQPMNDAYTGEVTWATLPIQSVDRVEVARGSSSSLYGGNAMGGVINILTRPVERRHVDATAQYGTYATGNYAGQYADRAGKVGLIVGGQWLDTDGYLTRPITVSPAAGSTGVPVTGAASTLTTTGGPAFVIGQSGKNWYEQGSARAKLEFTPAPTALFNVHYVFQRSEFGHDGYRSDLRDANGATIDRGPVLVNDGSVVRQLNFTPGTFVQGPGDQRSHLLNTSYRQSVGQYLVQVSGGVSSQPDNTTRTPVAATATATADGGPGAIAIRDSRSYIVNSQLTRPLASGGELTGGFDMRREWSDNRDFSLPDWTSRDNRGSQTFQSHGDTRNLAGFIQLRHPLGSRVAATVGGRFDHWRTFDGSVNIFNAAVPPTAYDDRTNRAVTGRASLVVTPTAAWTLRGSVGTAFRNPTVFELYRTFRLSTGTVFYASPDLEPERNLGIEAAVVRRLGSAVALEATYFRNQTTDLIYRKADLDADPTGRTRVLVNAGEATTNGVELSARARIGSWLQLRGQYTFTDALITRNPALPETEGMRVPFNPDHMAGASLLLAHGPWTGSLTGRYVAGLFSLDNNSDTTKGVMGSYSPNFVAGLSAGYDIGRGVQAFGSIDNLLDRQYYVFFLNPGRSVNVGLRLNLGR